jgi:hypothetical protein
MDINLSILKSAALVAENSEYFDEVSEYSEEDEMPDGCKNNNKEENQCA